MCFNNMHALGIQFLSKRSNILIKLMHGTIYDTNIYHCMLRSHKTKTAWTLVARNNITIFMVEARKSEPGPSLPPPKR